jgi:V8-like Glu-specific endopeptidase
MRIRELTKLKDEPATESFPEQIAEEVRAEQQALYAGRPGPLVEGYEQHRAFEGPPGASSEPHRPAWTSRVHMPPVTALHPRSRSEITAGIDDKIVWLLGQERLHTLEGELLPPCGYPWSTIGRVEAGTGTDYEHYPVHGTGVLVGPNLLLTASHVMQWDRPEGVGWWMRFMPGFVGGVAPPFGVSYVQSVHGYVTDDQREGSPSGLDYVICKLYQPLGERVGWMGTQSWSDEDEYYDRRWTAVGYPDTYLDGSQPVMDLGMEVEDIDDDANDSYELEFDTNPAMSHGCSGGPLWNWVGDEPKVVGIRSGAETDGWDPRRDVFAGGPPMVGLAQYGWDNWQ